MPWTAAGRTPEEIHKIKDFSNPRKNPFTVDPRSQKRIEAYRNKEKARSKWLNDYRQFERCRVTIPDNTPKTFDAFLKHKLTGDDTYKLWELDYRRRSKLLAHPEQALPGADKAIAADAKFTRYFFNPESREGYPKGRAFSSRLSRSTRVRFLILFWFPFRTVRRAARRGPTKTCRSSPGPSDIPCFGSPLHFFAWADSQWPDRTGRRYHSVLVSLPDFLAPGQMVRPGFAWAAAALGCANRFRSDGRILRRPDFLRRMLGK